MAKLYFRYGTVGSSKTLNLLSVAHTYEQQEKSVCVIKPAIDTRYGKEIVKSRSGLQRKADFVLETSLAEFDPPKVDCYLVDEVQFLSSRQVDKLRIIASLWNSPVICYGLRADFRGNLFEGSKRLFELADCIEEVKNVCHYCHQKSTMNLKHVNGVATSKGPSIELGAEEKYFPVCYSCYTKALNE